MKCPKCKGNLVGDGHNKGRYYFRCKACGRKIPASKIAPNYAKTEETDNSKYTEKIVKRVPRNLKEAVDLHNINKDVWQASKYITSSWGTDKNPQHLLKVWWRRRDSIDPKAAVKFFQQHAKNFNPQIKLPKVSDPQQQGKGLWVLNIADLHLGCLALAEEAGEDYNIEIAKKHFESILDDQIFKCNPYKISEIVFVIGNDFFHVDNQYNTTSKGTSVDTDGKWWQHYKIGVKLLTDAVYRLALIGKPVRVIVVPGNHDREKMFYMGAHLESMFELLPHINVDNRVALDKFYRFGKCLLGFSHKGGKPADLFADMAHHPDWNKTLHREWHIAHTHRDKMEDYKGVVIRRLCSSNNTDAWHAEHRFRWANKGAQSFLFHPELGLQGTSASRLGFLHADLHSKV